MFDPVLFAALMGSTALFSPSSLFSAGEQGAWYDPSDFSTMFQDSAGTTPVTAVEQPVGLIQDKSGRGNHASQSTSASRPVLSARVNLLTYSEDPTFWSTIGSTVSVKTVTATATTNRHGIINPGSTAPASTVCTATVQVTRVNSDFIQIAGSSGGFYANFNISSGVVGTRGGVRVIASSIAPVSAGTYDCTVTFTGNADQLWVILAQTASDGVLPSYAAVGTEAFICVRADMRVTNDGVGLPAYQRVAAATDYDTSGFPLYLLFDGTDDSLATGSIDPGSVDKAQVFAGVRKLSDAVQAFLVEYSANVNSNNGALALQAPNTPSAPYYWTSKGTVRGDAFNTLFAAPITNVVTGLGDISGDSATLRVNGVQQVQTTTDQGTGNFLSYPLYIGRRAGTSNPFKGKVYSLILRFSAANLSDAQISSTETWVNGKTGAY